MSTTAITNIRIFDGAQILENEKDVIIDEHGLIRFSSVGTDALKIDGTGKTLVPGLWDTHVHLSTPGPAQVSTERSIPLLKTMATYGITMAVDCGRMEKEQYEYVKSRDDLPDIRYVGNFATSTGSSHSKFVMADEDSIVDDVEAARRFVATIVEQGADCIKIVADVPGPSQQVINELSKQARENAKLTIVHAARKKAFEMALDASPCVDIITHAPLNEPLTEGDARKMATVDITAVPTLVMEEALSNSKYIPGATFDAAFKSVQLLHAAGVKVLVGTDSNQSPIGVKHGEAFHREIELLEKVGMTPLEILHAATQLSAECFNMDDRGVIASGKRADLVLVDGDPTTDIRALKNVRYVWKAGKEIYSAEHGAS